MALVKSKLLNEELVNRQSSEPPAKQLARELGRLILEGQIRADQRLPSQVRLAKMLGVGTNTVQEVMDELVSRGLVMRNRGRGTFIRSIPASEEGKLALIFWHQPDVDAEHEWGHPSAEWDYFRAALMEARSTRLQLVTDSWEQISGPRADLAVTFAQEKGYEAVLLFNVRRAHLPQIERLAQKRPRVAMVNAEAACAPLSCFTVDFLVAARQAAERIGSLNHRRVVVLGGGDEDFLVYGQISDAIVQALRERQMDARLVKTQQELAEAMASDRRPTVLWNASARPEPGLSWRQVIDQLGLRVPQDVSLIGSREDRPQRQSEAASIAFIDQPSNGLVRVGVKALLAAGDLPVRLNVPASFRDGATLAEARGQ
jgi:DNA-binding transcriptional regulator YhcF (GntR family)/DNA-binding LacI/PurR family transcriptional regulator